MKNKKVANSKILPLHYQEYQIHDLKEDKKIALVIQIMSCVVVGFMVLITFLLDLPMKNELSLILKIVLTVVFVFVYMVIHELTHGVLIRIISKEKPSYAIRFPYLITGSNHYYNKQSFLLILLTPVILWGLIVLVLLIVLPDKLFMSSYVVFGLNFAGSSGDFVQAIMIKRLPDNTLIQDKGDKTTYFLPVIIS